MDCGIFSDFVVVLDSMMRILVGKRAARYLDLIHFPLLVRSICLFPDISSTEMGKRERDNEKDTFGRGRRGWDKI